MFVHIIINIGSLKHIVHTRYIFKDLVFNVNYFGKPRRFIVEDILPGTSDPTAIFVVSKTTTTTILNGPESSEEKKPATTESVSYMDIGGLTEEIKMVREMVETSLKNPEVFRQYGMRPSWFFI